MQFSVTSPEREALLDFDVVVIICAIRVTQMLCSSTLRIENIGGFFRIQLFALIYHDLLALKNVSKHINMEYVFSSKGETD